MHKAVENKTRLEPIVIEFNVVEGTAKDGVANFIGSFVETFTLEDFLKRYMSFVKTWGSVYADGPGGRTLLFNYQDSQIISSNPKAMLTYRFRTVVGIEAYGTFGTMNYYIKFSESTLS